MSGSPGLFFFFFWVTAIAEIRLWIVSFVLLLFQNCAMSINLLHFERGRNLMANFQNDEFKILLVDFA